MEATLEATLWGHRGAAVDTCGHHPSSDHISIDLSGRETTRLDNIAEGGGFEPPEARTSTVFKTVAIVRSAIPPPTTLLPPTRRFL